jgi:3D-(3,5/4)-trihydroxycyclohexane-1,2-dione acylhydrolase (decyclizing)
MPVSEAPLLPPEAAPDTVVLTAAQAIVRFLQVQYSERDGVRRRLIPGMLGIFGHGNVAGMGQALAEVGDDLPYYQPKNEQAMVHTAIGYAKSQSRLATLACSASIGPGTTNMITGAATATTNRVPVLLLASDTFANRRQGPVLQQLEHPTEADLTVSDCLRPVSRFFDRITRPEQLITALPEAMRVLLDAADTGAVTLSLHQDVQGEAYAFPVALFAPRTWTVTRRPPAPSEVAPAADVLAAAQRPVMIVGGGVHYSEAGAEVRALSERFGIPVLETFGGKSASGGTELLLGGVGVTGTQAAYRAARDADVVLCVGTRLADFATGSHSIFQDPAVRFVSINVGAADAYKLGAVPIVADARAGLQALSRVLADRGMEPAAGYREHIRELRRQWEQALDEDLGDRTGEAMSQGQVLRLINEQSRAADVVVGAAGSAPSDVLRTWDAANGSRCALEFGFSCMGHEIPAGLGLRLGRPEGEVYVTIGDGTFLMGHSTELVTARQEGWKITLVLFVNHGFQCIRDLQLLKSGVDFGNEFRARGADGRLSGPTVEVDYAQNLASLGCGVHEVRDLEGVRSALQAAREADGPVAIVAHVEPHRGVIGSETWWDVGVAQVSQLSSTRDAVAEHLTGVERQRVYY